MRGTVHVQPPLQTNECVPAQRPQMVTRSPQSTGSCRSHSTITSSCQSLPSRSLVTETINRMRSRRLPCAELSGSGTAPDAAFSPEASTGSRLTKWTVPFRRQRTSRESLAACESLS